MEKLQILLRNKGKTITNLNKLHQNKIKQKYINKTVLMSQYKRSKAFPKMLKSPLNRSAMVKNQNSRLRKRAKQ